MNPAREESTTAEAEGKGMEGTEANRCDSIFDGSRCVKHSGHRGKHFNDDNCQFVQWTKGGLMEWLKEQQKIKT
jgi:hypothetical protein